jgi:hypothetical protein
VLDARAVGFARDAHDDVSSLQGVGRAAVDPPDLHCAIIPPRDLAPAPRATDALLA